MLQLQNLQELWSQLPVLLLHCPPGEEVFAHSRYLLKGSFGPCLPLFLLLYQKAVWLCHHCSSPLSSYGLLADQPVATSSSEQTSSELSSKQASPQGLWPPWKLCSKASPVHPHPSWTGQFAAGCPVLNKGEHRFLLIYWPCYLWWSPVGRLSCFLFKYIQPAVHHSPKSFLAGWLFSQSGRLVQGIILLHLQSLVLLCWTLRLLCEVIPQSPLHSFWIKSFLFSTSTPPSNLVLSPLLSKSILCLPTQSWARVSMSPRATCVSPWGT